MSDELLARKPWEPTGRKVIRKRRPLQYLWETDDEMTERHAVKRAKYEQQDATDAVIYNASGQPIGITGRTGQPGPGAARSMAWRAAYDAQKGGE